MKLINGIVITYEFEPGTGSVLVFKDSVWVTSTFGHPNMSGAIMNRKHPDSYWMILE